MIVPKRKIDYDLLIFDRVFDNSTLELLAGWVEKSNVHTTTNFARINSSEINAQDNIIKEVWEYVYFDLLKDLINKNMGGLEYWGRSEKKGSTVSWHYDNLESVYHTQQLPIFPNNVACLQCTEGSGDLIMINEPISNNLTDEDLDNLYNTNSNQCHKVSFKKGRLVLFKPEFYHRAINASGRRTVACSALWDKKFGIKEFFSTPLGSIPFVEKDGKISPARDQKWDPFTSPGPPPGFNIGLE